MSRARSLLALVVAALFLAACNTSTVPDLAAPDAAAPAALPGQYIVVLKDEDLSTQSVQGFALRVDRVVTDLGLQAETPLQLIDGFVVKNVDAATAARLANDPRVAYVQPDRIITLPPFTSQGKPGGGGSGQPAQTVPWGVKRIGAENLSNNGAGVDVFVIDTGIDSDHPDLQVVDGYAPVTCRGGSCLQAWDDDNEHGSHVAGTIAALDNSVGVVGVAPDARLHAVKVLNSRGSGSYSGIIQGIQWVTRYSSANPRVINMSLGGTGTDTGCNNGDALHDAVCAAVEAGVTVVVAAGNEDDDAANHTPAAYDEAITVSATGNDGDDGVGTDDFFAYFTNWGSDVAVAGPGYHVLSSVPGGGYASFSGTSMASPHTAGVAALYLSTQRSATPAQVKAALLNAATSTSGFRNDSSGAHAEGMLSASGF